MLCDFFEKINREFRRNVFGLNGAHLHTNQPELRIHHSCVVLLPAHFAGAHRMKHCECVGGDETSPVLIRILRQMLAQRVC